MSTNDVPGHKASNKDTLAMGCWAEHSDGSLIFVEAVEGGRVIYCIFDTQPSPIVQYRDAMPEKGFKTQFSWGKGKKDKWTWHDKTVFPWDRVIKEGAQPGSDFVSADDLITAAQRVAESRHLRGSAYQPKDDQHRQDQSTGKIRQFVDKLQSAIDDLKA